MEKEHKITGKNYKKYYFNKVALSELKFFGEMFYVLEYLENSKYSKHRKILPSKDLLLKNLTPRALAYWYMDDGSFKGDQNGAVLCTDNFTKTQVELLCAVILEKYQIKTSIHKDSNNYRIYIPVYSFNLFYTIIKPYIIPEMLYKLGSNPIEK